MKIKIMSTINIKEKNQVSLINITNLTDKIKVLKNQHSWEHRKIVYPEWFMQEKWAHTKTNLKRGKERNKLFIGIMNGKGIKRMENLRK